MTDAEVLAALRAAEAELAEARELARATGDATALALCAIGGFAAAMIRDELEEALDGPQG